jgi:hypothetical protein
MKKLIPCLAIVMSGCVVPRYPQPIVTTQADNNVDYEVSYLFEYGGCKVYRFYDRYYSNAVYYTNCGGETVALKDSSQVRSTGSLRSNSINLSSYTKKDSSVSPKIKPTNISSFIKAK